jgi:hypothetical protein
MARGLILCKDKRFFHQNISTGPGVPQLTFLCVQGGTFFPSMQSGRNVKLTERGLKISGTIPPLPYTSYNGVQRYIIMILCFWIVSAHTTYSGRVEVHRRMEYSLPFSLLVALVSI